MTHILGWQQIPSPIISEIMARNYHGVVLDLEHSLWSISEIFSSIQVITLLKKQCFVRIHKRDLNLISRLLDSGITGLILSTVESEQEAISFIDASLYPNQGGSRGTGLVRQNMWGDKDLSKPQLPVLIPQIETVVGISNIESIIKPQFSFYLVGPYDLSASLGCEGNFSNKKFVDAIKSFESAIRPEKRAIHIPDKVIDHVYKYSNFGMICLGMDTIDLIRSSRENLDNAKRVFNTHTNKKEIPESK